MACGQEMTYGRSILEDLRLAEEAGMVFPEAAEEVEAEVDELEALDTAQLRDRGKELGVEPVGDKRKTEVWKRGLRAARGAVLRGAAGSSGSSDSSSSSSSSTRLGGGRASQARACAEARPKRRLADGTSGSGTAGGGGRVGGRGSGRSSCVGGGPQ
jgi:hypothetical protein